MGSICTLWAQSLPHVRVCVSHMPMCLSHVYVSVSLTQPCVCVSHMPVCLFVSHTSVCLCVSHTSVSLTRPCVSLTRPCLCVSHMSVCLCVSHMSVCLCVSHISVSLTRPCVCVSHMSMSVCLSHVCVYVSLICPRSCTLGNARGPLCEPPQHVRFPAAGQTLSGRPYSHASSQSWGQWDEQMRRPFASEVLTRWNKRVNLGSCPSSSL